MPTKVWVVGEEVLAADMNAYVQEQIVATFANAAARDAALPTPKAGMLTYQVDTKTYTFYDGSAWLVLRGSGTGLYAVGGQSGTIGTSALPLTNALTVPALPYANRCTIAMNFLFQGATSYCELQARSGVSAATGTDRVCRVMGGTQLTASLSYFVDRPAGEARVFAAYGLAGAGTFTAVANAPYSILQVSVQPS